MPQKTPRHHATAGLTGGWMDGSEFLAPRVFCFFKKRLVSFFCALRTLLLACFFGLFLPACLFFQLFVGRNSSLVLFLAVGYKEQSRRAAKYQREGSFGPKTLTSFSLAGLLELPDSLMAYLPLASGNQSIHSLRNPIPWLEGCINHHAWP